jgi:hypothetical protein
MANKRTKEVEKSIMDYEKERNILTTKIEGLKKSQSKNFRVAVPEPWMWDQIEKYGFDNDLHWRHASTQKHLDGWKENKKLSGIVLTHCMTYSNIESKVCEELIDISFYDFCKSVDFQPVLWGVSCQNKDQFDYLFADFKSAHTFDRNLLDLSPFCFEDGDNEWSLLGISEKGLLYRYQKDELKALGGKEVSVEQACDLMGKPFQQSHFYEKLSQKYLKSLRQQQIENQITLENNIITKNMSELEHSKMVIDQLANLNEFHGKTIKLLQQELSEMKG